jgi:hypothetical protein
MESWGGYLGEGKGVVRVGKGVFRVVRIFVFRR